MSYINKQFICCICNKVIVGSFGNNPRPVKDKGKCCDSCNYIVIQARDILLNYV